MASQLKLEQILYPTSVTPAITINSDDTVTFGAPTTTITNLSATNLAYTGTLTGGTGVVNIGSGQIYKDASGNVGIGTSSPGHKLQVSGATDVVGLYSSNATAYQRFFGSTTTASPYLGADGNNFVFGSWGVAERMRIDSSGNVGIGTSSPTQPLSIVRGAGVAAYLDLAGGGRTLGTTSFTFGQANDGVVAFFQRENAAMYWATNATERMRLDASGNLGLGVTPSAWFSTIKAFDIGSGAVWGLSTGNNLSVGSNIFTNTSGDTVYKTNGNATRFLQLNGAYQWFTAPSGTAGNAISFTQAMTLTAAGALGLGTTSPNLNLEIAAAASSSGFVGLRVTDTVANLSAQLFRTGSAYSYAGVGANETWLYSQGSSNLSLGPDGAGAVKFVTNGGERARIDSSGNLLVGTTASVARMVVLGAGATSATYAQSVLNSGGFELFAVRNDGAISTGLRAGSPYNLTIGSAANAVLNSDGFLYRSTSSLKYKADVQDATHGLAKLLTLRSVTYKGKSDADGNKVYGGLIAEEVHEAGLSEFVQYAEDGSPDALAYGNMVSLCIKAIQEQQALITQLQADVAALKA